MLRLFQWEQTQVHNNKSQKDMVARTNQRLMYINNNKNILKQIAREKIKLEKSPQGKENKEETSASGNMHQIGESSHIGQMSRYPIDEYPNAQTIGEIGQQSQWDHEYHFSDENADGCVIM